MPLGYEALVGHHCSSPEHPLLLLSHSLVAPSHCLNQWLLISWTIENTFSAILLKIQTFSLNDMHWKLSSAKCQLILCRSHFSNYHYYQQHMGWVEHHCYQGLPLKWQWLTPGNKHSGLTHWSLWDVAIILDWYSFNLYQWWISWVFTIKLLLGECHKTWLMISQNWFR